MGPSGGVQLPKRGVHGPKGVRKAVRGCAWVPGGMFNAIGGAVQVRKQF